MKIGVVIAMVLVFLLGVFCGLFLADRVLNGRYAFHPRMLTRVLDTRTGRIVRSHSEGDALTAQKQKVIINGAVLEFPSDATDAEILEFAEENKEQFWPQSGGGGSSAITMTRAEFKRQYGYDPQMEPEKFKARFGYLPTEESPKTTLSTEQFFASLLASSDSDSTTIWPVDDSSTPPCKADPGHKNSTLPDAPWVK